MHTEKQDNIPTNQSRDLPGFPEHVKWDFRKFETWSREIKVEHVPCCTPDTIEHVLEVVNWAKKHDYKVRPIGQSHNWSPLIFKPKASANRIMLMDLQPHFNQVSIEQSSPVSIVKAQTGVLMETLMTKMEEHGLGFTATPAPGDLTLGGVLAIGGHGTAINALGEKNEDGHTYGSLCNSILSFSAVVWDESGQKYILKEFQRTDPDCAPLLTSLGSVLILEAQLQAGKNQRLRCESFTDIPATELFLSPQNTDADKQTISHFLDKSGRIEVILFPFTEKPWLKIWSLSPEKPNSSVEVSTPYNYPFTEPTEATVKQLTDGLKGYPSFTPTACTIQYNYIVDHLSKQGKDIWGWSKNLLLYVKPTTLQVTANGYVVLTRRADVQRVLSVFYTYWKTLIEEFEDNEKYPINGPLEVRVTGLDTPSEVVHQGAAIPSLSALRPRPDKPEWDTAVWLDILTIPGTRYAPEFMRRFEQWLFQEFNGTYAAARVEWSKGWAYTKNAAWEDEDVLTQKIPASFTDGQPADSNWAATISLLNKHDPHHIFRSTFLDKLFSI
ncbi:FAD-linked oxidase [Xenorhabdus mauleonii]|uniref:FAD binding domain-containing protein n=1 Tax=Xenorhabdus mauleonii TaxID=351675 RepID=A0A1I3W039_9GAMM|nr:cholesterol oxidase substrate-binding domain-containing protein [Xenorhabdus mauleonii]PHM36922.1 FAD-linked oxidase [Xenorhabdus mauleonii]SFJ99846.1 FAD binding domain-containing protein [Xenorhabdus mauleonii]